MAKLLTKLGFPAFRNLSAEHRAGVLGVGWTTVGQVAALGIKVVSVLKVPQFLGPADYGIFSTAIAVTMIVEFLSDIGLRPAIVRHPDGEKASFIGTAWLIMMGRGFLLAAIILALGALLPQLYRDLDAAIFFPVIACLAVRPIMHAFSNPMAMLLHRHMRFGRWSLLEFSQTLVGTAATILSAWLIQNVWAIVIGTLTGELTFMVLTYVLCKRPPRPRWDPAVAEELSHFGNQVFVNTLVMALWLFVDRLVGPVYIPIVLMGLYGIAWQLMEVIERLATRICDIYYSALTKIEDPAAQVAFHRKMCRKAAVLGMPLLAAAIVLAPWSIRLVYPAKYYGAGILFSALICRVMFRILGQLQFQLLLARAEIRLATRCYWLAFGVQLAAVFPLAFCYGPLGLAYSVVISTFVLTLRQNLIFVRRGEMGLQSFVITFAWMAAGWTAVVMFAI